MEQISKVFGISKYEQISNRNKIFQIKSIEKRNKFSKWNEKFRTNLKNTKKKETKN
jgi:hypothetical protein